MEFYTTINKMYLWHNKIIVVVFLIFSRMKFYSYIHYYNNTTYQIPIVALNNIIVCSFNKLLKKLFPAPMIPSTDTSGLHIFELFMLIIRWDIFAMYVFYMLQFLSTFITSLLTCVQSVSNSSCCLWGPERYSISHK